MSLQSDAKKNVIESCSSSKMGTWYHLQDVKGPTNETHKKRKMPYQFQNN